MAEQSTGVKYAISIDDTELRKAAQESAKAFDDIASQAVKSGNKMDSIFDKAAASAAGAVDDFASLSDQIKFQKDIIAGLEKDLKVLEEAYKNAAPGRDWADAVSKFNSAKAELQGEKQALEELEAQAKNTANSQVSMRTRMREVREELIALEAAGKRGTEEYRRLQEEAGKLQDAYSDASAQMRIMANDQRGMQGIISGLTGVSAAFSAASGVVGLFTKDNEKLQQAMLRVQSLMSITVGLQQIQQTLNKDSAFRLVIINGLKDWWTKATQKATAAMVAETAATKAAGTAAATSAGFFRTLGVALKSLSAGAITAILAALTAVAVIVAKLVKGEKQISGEFQRQKEYINGVREARVEAQKATIKEATAMEQSVARLSKLKSGTKEYERTVKEIAEKLGVQYDWLVKNTDKVGDLAKAWRDVKIAQATGDAYLDKAASVKTDTLAAIAKLQNIKKSEDARDILGQLGFVDSKFIDNYVKLLHNFRKSGGSAYGVTKERVWEMIKDMENQLVSLSHAQADKFVVEFNKEMDKQTKAMKPLTDAMDEAGRQQSAQEAAKRARERKKEEYEAAGKAIEEGERKLDEYREQLQRKYTENDIASEQDATKRRLREIKDREEQELEALRQFGDKVLEQERENARNRATLSGEEYDETAVTLPDGFQRMLDIVEKQITDNAQRQRDAVTAEARRAYDELAKEYAGLEGKIAAIKARYAKQIETAGGDSSLASRIRESQRREIAALVLDSFKAEESIGKVAEQVQSLGQAARTALHNNLQRIVDFVTRRKAQNGLPEQLRESVSEFASLNNVSEEFLNRLLETDGAFDAFVEYVKNIGEQSESIDNVSKAIKNFKEAKEKAVKSGDIIDIDNLEYAQQLLDEMTKRLADNILNTADAIGQMLREIAEMTGNEAFAKAGDIMSDIVGNLQAAEQGAQAWGGWWGAIIGGLTDLIPRVIKWINTGNEESLESIERQASKTELLLGYWQKIYEYGSRWTVPDIGGIGSQLSDLYAELERAERQYNNAVTWAQGKSGERKVAQLRKRRDDLLDEITQLENRLREASAPTREEAYNNTLAAYNDRITELQRRITALKEHARKNIDEIRQAYVELAQAIQDRDDFIRQDLEDTLGFTATSLASQISDALASAFDSGSDAAKAFGNTVSDVMRNVVKNIVMTRVIEDKLNEMFNEMALINFKGQDPDMAKANYIFQWLHDNLEPMIEGMGEMWEKAARQFGWDTTTAATGATKGIATASQDSLDELNGRMTVIQAHTASLVQSSALSASNTTAMLSALNGIHSDTSQMRTDLNAMRTDLNAIRNNM